MATIHFIDVSKGSTVLIEADSGKFSFAIAI